MNEENVLYLHNGILFSHKQNEILPFSVKWMEVEVIMLSEIIQKQKDKYCMLALSQVKALKNQPVLRTVINRE